MAGGFVGRYGVVDLTTGRTEEVRLEEAVYRKFLGGYGLGAAVIARRQPPGIDPLSPQSHLGFCSGLLTGTGVPFSGRFMVVGKSPLTGGWGDANAGGFFSRELKRAGYDALFFRGVSPHPIWVYVEHGRIHLEDARRFWGGDAVDTEEAIRERLGDKRVQVAAIGSGGEKRSLMAGVVTAGGRIAARSGLGALMGSKHLKALAVRGDGPIHVAHPEQLRSITRRFLREYRRSRGRDRLTVRFLNSLSAFLGRTGLNVPPQPSTLREIYRRYGTSGLTVYSAMVGDMPIKNWTGAGHADFSAQRAARISDERVVRYQTRRYACQGCPLGCGGIVTLPRGSHGGQEGHKPEYETLAAFGGLLLHDDLETIMELNEMCNRAGLDTISVGTAVAFAMECFERGILMEKDTGGLRLQWGDGEAVTALTRMIIERRGLGDLLADGVKRAAASLGQGAEGLAMHAGGQELPMHDARLDPGYAVVYQCEPTPARHTVSCHLYPRMFGVLKQFPAAGRMVRRAARAGDKKVGLAAAGAVYTQLLNGAGVCLFGALTGPFPLLEALNAVTGWELARDEVFTIGERILGLRKAFNAREGVRPVDQRISPRAAGDPPLEHGPLKGVRLDTAAMERVFFSVLGWDAITGGPESQTLRRLEIDDLFPAG